MVQISLKKLVSKEGFSLLNKLIDTIGVPVTIQDVEGRILLGASSHKLSEKHPVQLSGEVIGWVIGPEKAAAIASLLSHLATKELEKRTLANDLLDRYREITLLYDIAQKFTASLDLKEVARLVIEEARRLIAATSGILLLDNGTQKLEILAAFGLAAPSPTAFPLGKGIIGSVVATGNGEIVNDVLSDPRFVTRQTPINSLICVPLKTKDKVIGAIELSSQTAVTYTAKDLKLLTLLAFQAAITLDQAELYEQSRRAAIVAQDQAQQLQRTLYELQQTQTQLIQSEKMSSLGQLVAGVAHEINNPVNFIYGNLNYANQYIQDLLHLLHLYQQHCPEPGAEVQAYIKAIDLEFEMEDLPQLLSSMQLGTERIRELVLSLRNFSRLDRAEMKPVDIHEGIDGTLLILRNRMQSQNIQVIKEYGNLPLVECYASQLNQVFMNIIANAIDALENQKQPGKIAIRTSVARNQEDSDPKFFSPPDVVISIQDNGPGMSEAVRAHLFDPFFTTKPIGKGTGLGLSISHQIVERHGGFLKCLSQPGHGATFWIQIPIAPLTDPRPFHSKFTTDAEQREQGICTRNLGGQQIAALPRSSQP